MNDQSSFAIVTNSEKNWNACLGKLSLHKWSRHIKLFKHHDRHQSQGSTFPLDETYGYEVHKMGWIDINMIIWNMRHAWKNGVLFISRIDIHNYHAREDYIESISLFVFDDEKDSQVVENGICYWLMFVACNTRGLKSYRPRVTMLMTHHQIWEEKFNKSYTDLLKNNPKLRNMFRDVRDLAMILNSLRWATIAYDMMLLWGWNKVHENIWKYMISRWPTKTWWSYNLIFPIWMKTIQQACFQMWSFSPKGLWE